MLTLSKAFFGCLILILVVSINGLHAQNSRDIESRRAPIQLKEETPKKKLSKRQAKKQLEKSYANYFDRLVVEYEQRMQANARKNYKRAKELEKPRYSDPSYFGHKKPPKKRANGKKRRCKECHMWH